MGGPRVKALLATLVLHANHPVPVKALVDAAWDRDWQQASAATVHSYICRLRTRLAAAGTDGVDRICTDSNGYRLKVEPGESDVEVFRREVEIGRANATIGLLEEAGNALGRALALWRGPALSELPGKIARIEAVQLDDARIVAEEERLEIELAFQRDADVIPDLRKLLLQHPLRERLAALLMRALYRRGQQAEALQVYRTTRQALVDELAVEPGPDLHRLHQKILSQDAELDSPAAQAAVAINSLPATGLEFVGRAADVSLIMAMACAKSQAKGTALIGSINGMAGVGKTAFAVHVSHALAEFYPDGQLFVDLHGHSATDAPKKPVEALAELLESAGVPARAIPDTLAQRAAKWRDQLSSRRMLIVLDDAADVEQVRPLMPGGSGSLILVTSRNQLIGLNATHTLFLRPLATAEAIALFVTMLADGRGAAEPEAVAEVVELCGKLPLAIYLAAARLRHRPSWTVAELGHLLRRERLWAAEGDAGENRLVRSFAASYLRLNPVRQRMFRLLSLVQGRAFDLAAAAALAGLTPAEAESVLESLVDANMLESVSLERYQMHELLVSYGYSHRVSRDELVIALHRLLDYYLRTGTNAHRVLFPDSAPLPDQGRTACAGRNFADREEVVLWWETERSGFLQASLNSPTRQHGSARWECVRTLGDRETDRLHVVGRMFDGTVRLGDLAGTAARAGEARAVSSLGVLAGWLGRNRLSGRLHQRAQLLHRAGYDLVGEAAELCAMGTACERLYEFDKALDHYQRALANYREVDEPWGVEQCQDRLAALRRNRGLGGIDVTYQRRSTFSAGACASRRVNYSA
ncbi:AfsR/SARP family transcriptional regulator [Amycolatopsis sp. CA-230715]|uniref:AfsR/SARP family transcriptional regulator n=1 Tax=Amycolatopsis sp. CA-230715 TaxID=2745196 RepID=UPI001C032A17|nr:AfsR/SARP family transcriptional regulator [Amycolatopsis sp. CA-230715]